MEEKSGVTQGWELGMNACESECSENRNLKFLVRCSCPNSKHQMCVDWVVDLVGYAFGLLVCLFVFLAYIQCFKSISASNCVCACVCVTLNQ